jgi:hypothetical protein
MGWDWVHYPVDSCVSPYHGQIALEMWSGHHSWAYDDLAKDCLDDLLIDDVCGFWDGMTHICFLKQCMAGSGLIEIL